MKMTRKTLAYLWLAAAVVAIGGLPPGALAQGADADDEVVVRSAPLLPVGTVARYLVTWFKSSTGVVGSASFVSVTNQSDITCRIAVDWRINGVVTNLSQNLFAAPGQQVDFCTRATQGIATQAITTCNMTGALTSAEGNAIVGSAITPGCEKIAISARTVYTSNNDQFLDGITDAKVVKIGMGNTGD
jgi:hypothetical protein